MNKKYKKITLAPFCYSQLSINEMLKIILICIIPQMTMLAVTKSFDSIYLVCLVIFISICTELLYSLILRLDIKISWATILQGALIGLLIPSAYSLSIVAIITFLVLFFEKVIFKHFAQSWLNPIVFTAILLFFITPELYPSFMLMPETIQYENIGTKLFSTNIIEISQFDAQISEFLNSLLNSTGIHIPEGYITLFIDSQTTIPAFRFNAMTLLVSLILFSTKTIDFIIPTIFIVVYAILVKVFGLYPYAAIIGQGDILLALLTSGTLFTAFFLITWFGTTPKTLVGKIVFAITAGIIAFLICGAGTSCIGMLFVVLLLNIFCTIILHIEAEIYEAKLQKVLADDVGH